MYIRRHGRLCGGGGADPAHTDPAHWWIGAKLTCPECACHFTLEERDEGMVDTRPGQWGRGVWSCPECEGLVALDEWQPDQPPEE